MIAVNVLYVPRLHKSEQSVYKMAELREAAGEGAAIGAREESVFYPEALSSVAPPEGKKERKKGEIFLKTLRSFK